MKKLTLALLFSMLSITTFTVHAQETPENETTDIREIKVRYCNDPANTEAKSLFIDAKVDEKSVICIDFINTAKQKANIGINFVDGAITDDADQKKACLAEGEKSNFGQYVSNYPENIEIEPNSVKRVFVDLLYSGGFAGTSYGCLTYHALDSQTESQNVNGTMFNVFSRVGSFIDAFVAGDFKIALVTTPIQSEFYTNIASNPNFIVYREGSWKEGFWKSSFWTYKAKVDMTNTGNIALSGDVQLTWQDFYILHDTITVNDQIFLPQQTRSFEVEIPWYIVRLAGGAVKVSAHVDYQPIYLGSYALTAPTDSFNLVDTTNVFFFPWIILIGLIYMAWILIHKKDINPSTTKTAFKKLFTKRKSANTRYKKKLSIKK